MLNGLNHIGTTILMSKALEGSIYLLWRPQHYMDDYVVRVFLSLETVSMFLVGREPWRWYVYGPEGEPLDPMTLVEGVQL